MKKSMVFTAAIAVMALAGTGLANIVGNPITVQATNGLGTGTVVVHLSDGTYNPVTGQFTYSQVGSVPILSASGQTIAILNGLTMFALGDPAMSMGFAVDNGPLATLFSISSGLNNFAPLTNPNGHSSAALTLTDTGDGAGAALVGNLGGFAFEAGYNGLLPAATPYAFHGPSFAVASGSDFRTGNSAAPIVGVVSSISTAFNFTLTPFDSASGTSTFAVTANVPTPGALALLGIGGLSMVRRRR